VQYNDLSNRTLSYSAQSAPPEHQKKVTLLLYFAEYMYTHLSAGGNLGLHTPAYSPTGGAGGGTETAVAGGGWTAREAPVFMKKWFRTDRAIVMYLSNGTLQVGRSRLTFAARVKAAFHDTDTPAHPHVRHARFPRARCRGMRLLRCVSDQRHTVVDSRTFSTAFNITSYSKPLSAP